MVEVSRRSMLGTVALVGVQWSEWPALGAGVRADAGDVFPAQDPALVREIVGASHRDVERVTALLKDMPQLANAAYDWGFGDWETALGAASHTGRRPIAKVLIEHGARLDIFAHAMLGHEGVVRAMIAATPEIARLRGPHGISLMHHARAGGDESKGVVEFLATIPDADLALAQMPLSDEEKAACAGVYAYGAGESERLEVFTREDGLFMIKRAKDSPRTLRHAGDRVFHPAGAPDVRIVLTPKAGRAERMEITAPKPICTAERVEG